MSKEFKKIDKRSATWKAMSKEDKELYNQLLKDSKKSKGLGDTIEKITSATGVKSIVKSIWGPDCGCDERKAKLNKKFKYKNMACMNEEEYIYLKDLFSRLGSKIQPADQTKAMDIYNRNFNQNHKSTQCVPCWIGIINNLRQLYDEYVKEME